MGTYKHIGRPGAQIHPTAITTQKTILTPISKTQPRLTVQPQSADIQANLFNISGRKVFKINQDNKARIINNVLITVPRY